MKTKITLIADKGKILTNGTHYGRIVYLAEGDYAISWYEIPEEEYNRIMKEKEAEVPQ